LAILCLGREEEAEEDVLMFSRIKFFDLANSEHNRKSGKLIDRLDIDE
jgi:hypothetical protein